MKNFFLAILLLVSPAAFAGDTTVSIHEGDWEVSGSAALDHTTGNSRTYFRTSGNVQYFFADQFSAGLVAGVSGGSGGSFNIGPVFTKYFAVADRMAPYVSIAPIRFYNYSSGSDYAASMASVGVKFFFNDYVAFGPEVEYSHVWPSQGYRSSGRVSLNGLFSIHL